MKTKRLTLESFKSLVKRIIKEEMYRNPEEKNVIVQNDTKKSLELSNGTIEKAENGLYGRGEKSELLIKTNINRDRDGNSLRIILGDKINQEFIFDYYNDNYSFWKYTNSNTLTKEGAFKFLDIINNGLGYMQVNNPKTDSQEPRIIDFLTNPDSKREFKF
jgi:hypothetical protein